MVSDYKTQLEECQATSAKNSTEIKAQLFFVSGGTAETTLTLFAADFTQELQGGLVRGGEGLMVAFRCQLTTMTLSHNPIARQVTIDPDNEKIMMFLPAHNQGSVTVQ